MGLSAKRHYSLKKHLPWHFLGIFFAIFLGFRLLMLSQGCAAPKGSETELTPVLRDLSGTRMYRENQF